jgi:transcriptional regulator GlxA family with amidase domain
MTDPGTNLRVSLLATTDTFMGSISGLLETLTLAREVTNGLIPFELEIVARTLELEIGLTGMRLQADRTLAAADQTDIVIVAASVTEAGTWVSGRYPQEVQWLRRMHEQGAIICSACSGALLLAETGLLDGEDITTHWMLERIFQEQFPKVRLRLDRELVVSPDRRLVMSGASATWHDLALYLVTRFSGPATARSIAKFFMLHWHAEGQTPYIPFNEPTTHGDRAILNAQIWLQQHWQEPNPVDAMVLHSGLSERNFTRRFRKATGYAPLSYVQRLRIERAKQLIENTSDAIDQISADVGYEDASFFRRVFKRTVGLKPIEYRRKFKAGSFATVT